MRHRTYTHFEAGDLAPVEGSDVTPPPDPSRRHGGDPPMEPINDWLDDAMPNLKKERLGRHREHPVHRRVTEGVDREAQLYAEHSASAFPKARSIQQANVLSALEQDIEKDMVNLPEHYARFKIEPIHFIGENNLNWFQGNILKYMLRYDAKNGMEDLKKARRYMDMFIAWHSGDPDWWRVGKDSKR